MHLFVGQDNIFFQTKICLSKASVKEGRESILCYNLFLMAQHISVNNMEFSVGDTVRVHQRIQEGEKTRIQIFEGLVIAIQNKQSGKSFTVRKIATGGIGVERIFPVFSPVIERVERKQLGHVHRAKLFFLRDRIGKAAMNIRKKVNASAKTA